MLRSVVFLVATLCVLGIAAENPAHIQNAYFNRRSGNFVLDSKNASAQSRFMTLSQLIEKYDKNMKHTEIADLLLHNIGALSINPDVNRENFAAHNIFAAPKANLFLVVNDMTEAEVSELGLSAAKFRSVAVTDIASPSDAVAQVTTALSGVQPASHGIVAASWPSPAGERISAFSADGLPVVGNAPTVLSKNTQGHSFTLGASLSSVLARALSVHPTVAIDNAFWNNARIAREFDELTSSLRLPGFRLPSLRELRQQLATPTWIPESLRESYTVLKGAAVRVNLDGASAEFAFDQEQDFDFLSEMYLARLIFSSLKTPTFASAVADEFPDFLSFGVSTIGAIKARYGADSAKARVAIKFVGAILRSVIDEASEAYESRVVPSFFFVAPAAPLASGQAVLTRLGGELLNEENAAHYLPYVYLAEPTAARVASYCSIAQNAAEDNVVCFEATHEYFDDVVIDDDINNGTSGNKTAIGPESVAKFQTCLWTGIILGLTALGAILALFNMETGTDTLLYRSAGSGVPRG